jgi:glycosyltransferase involved in cell wall biosynthesis
MFSFGKGFRNYRRRWFDNRREQIDRLETRISKLELLSTEHPNFMSTSFQKIPFLSPVVSVIMPTWNRASVVGAAVRSVQAQYFSDWELIVLDDGSADDTTDVIASFAIDRRIRYFKLPHAGQSAARNYGLRIAKGAIIAYLDSDDLWYPGFLAAAVPVFGTRDDVDCLYGAMIADGGQILFEPFDRERLIVGNYIDTSTFIHRRALIERFGCFDEELTALEDWDLVLRYTTHAPAYRLPVLAVRYRATDNIRISVTEPLGQAAERIRHKWIKS